MNHTYKTSQIILRGLLIDHSQFSNLGYMTPFEVLGLPYFSMRLLSDASAFNILGFTE